MAVHCASCASPGESRDKVPCARLRITSVSRDRCSRRGQKGSISPRSLLDRHKTRNDRSRRQECFSSGTDTSARISCACPLLRIEGERPSQGRARGVELDREHPREVRKVRIRRQDAESSSRGRGADEVVRVGALDPPCSAFVEEGGCFLVVLRLSFTIMLTITLI